MVVLEQPLPMFGKPMSMEVIDSPVHSYRPVKIPKEIRTEVKK